MNIESDPHIEVRKFPTRLHVRCSLCAHQGVVEVFLNKPPKLVCIKCGNKNPIVTSRDRTRAWGAAARQMIGAAVNPIGRTTGHDRASERSSPHSHP